MTKILSSSTRIRFQDCDPFNHLNNGRYIDYFINAREDHLMEYYDLNLFDLVKKEGIGWVVSSSKLSFIRPVFTMEHVKIESQIIEFGRNHTLVELRMFSEEDGLIKSFAWINFVHFNLKTNKVSAHQERFMDLFEQINLPVEQSNFDDREVFFRQELRKQTK
ncbi:MAG: acyl-CoA thioesterase [Flavobacteriaceae bacterium]|nr:acyl-CoA thioesterase [Flavobacteriaceae bacterium]